MRILEITFEKPSMFSGGGIVIKQSILGLLAYGDVDYIGPSIQDDMFGTYANFRVLHTLEHDENKFRRILYMLFGRINGYIYSWNKASSQILWEQYDLVSIEFTKFDYPVRDAHIHGKKIILRMHNVESDYYKNIYKNGGNGKKLDHYLRYKIYSMNEKKCINFADALICITKEDKERVKELYKVDFRKLYVNPVCIEKNEMYKKYNNGFILATGSLWYGPNVDGIKWFIKEVWGEIKKIYRNCTFVIAGSNPEDELRKICDMDLKIELIENPKDITPYFLNACVYVAPIFNGAGMKVKVAEALKYGVPVVGTKHALIGYKGSNKGIYMANTAKDFINGMDIYLKMNVKQWKEVSDSNVRVFEENYSIERNQEFYLELLRNLGV